MHAHNADEVERSPARQPLKPDACADREALAGQGHVVRARLEFAGLGTGAQVRGQPISAFIPSAAIAVALALAAAFSALAGFSRFVGAITGAVLYSLIRDRSNVQCHDVDGETIAVRAA
ncbi:MULTISPECIES: hypothetical protein [unclassified Streptomyces]|uniref:hypothetical protein n=1 Tax=unclassified Streptomyces TaxID=2593676 RepID=UPI0036EA0732